MNNFPDAESELQSLVQALDREKEADRQRFEVELAQMPLALRVRAGVALSDLEAIDSRPVIGDRWRIRLRSRRPAARRVFSGGQPATLSPCNDQGEVQLNSGIAAIVSWSGDEETELVVDEYPDWIDNKGLALSRRFDERVYNDMQQAVGQAITARDSGFRRLRDTLLGHRSSTVTSVSARDQHEIAGMLAGFALNESQAQAVRLACSADLALVHGPPGTGKTTTISAAIQIAWRRGESVLALAPSNRAVDVLSERLAALGLPVLRLGHPARVDETLHSLTLDGWLERSPEAEAIRRGRETVAQLMREAQRFRRNFGPRERQEREELRREARRIRRNIAEIEQAQIAGILEKSKLICATLSVAATLPMERIFDRLFVDEAAQALPPSFWIGALRARRWVMAGDHCQLAPTVLSDAVELRETIFERSIGKATAPAMMLNRQYRMRPEIAAPSNTEFYQGLLLTDAEAAQRPAPQAALFERPLLFVDTAGAELAEQVDELSRSRHNPGEVKLLLDLLALFVPELESMQLSAALLTPYSSQAALLRSALRDRFPGRAPASADTIDAFQGGERDWIGISLVRSNETRETGFLSDVRRMNVAMTRARRFLLIVGDSLTLGSDPFYERLLAHIEEHGERRSAFEFLD